MTEKCLQSKFSLRFLPVPNNQDNRPEDYKENVSRVRKEEEFSKEVYVDQC